MTTAKWQCSRCGQWGGNPSCYVCATDDDDRDPDDALDFWEEMRNEEPEQTENNEKN